MQSTFHQLYKLLKFRQAMGLSLSKDEIKYIWGKRILKNFEKSKQTQTKELLFNFQENENRYVLEKLKYAKKHISKLKLFNWVRFIGISGSVAAGFAKEDDDIDIFVVVRNGTIWLYRAIIIFKNLFHNKIRAKRHKDIKNKLCLNLICEERGLEFENNIFNFHELIFLKPIYNRGYKNYILSQNKWLEKEYFVKKELLRSRIIPQKKVFFLIQILNYFAFRAQLLFMIIAKHSPEIKRIKKNSKKGRIEFFPYDFSEEKIKSYLNN